VFIIIIIIIIIIILFNRTVDKTQPYTRYNT